MYKATANIDGIYNEEVVDEKPETKSGILMETKKCNGKSNGETPNGVEAQNGDADENDPHMVSAEENIRLQISEIIMIFIAISIIYYYNITYLFKPGRLLYLSVSSCGVKFYVAFFITSFHLFQSLALSFTSLHLTPLFSAAVITSSCHFLLGLPLLIFFISFVWYIC